MLSCLERRTPAPRSRRRCTVVAIFTPTQNWTRVGTTSRRNALVRRIGNRCRVRGAARRRSARRRATADRSSDRRARPPARRRQRVIAGASGSQPACSRTSADLGRGATSAGRSQRARVMRMRRLETRLGESIPVVGVASRARDGRPVYGAEPAPIRRVERRTRGSPSVERSARRTRPRTAVSAQRACQRGSVDRVTCVTAGGSTIAASPARSPGRGSPRTRLGSEPGFTTGRCRRCRIEPLRVRPPGLQRDGVRTVAAMPTPPLRPHRQGHADHGRQLRARASASPTRSRARAATW